MRAQQEGSKGRRDRGWHGCLCAGVRMSWLLRSLLLPVQFLSVLRKYVKGPGSAWLLFWSGGSQILRVKSSVVRFEHLDSDATSSQFSETVTFHPESPGGTAVTVVDFC